MTDDQIHWFSIVNSVMIVLFLSGMVAMIMVRTLYRDISKYNQLDTQEDAAEETGWKLVSGVVWGCLRWGKSCKAAPCQSCAEVRKPHACVRCGAVGAHPTLGSRGDGHLWRALRREVLIVALPCGLLLAGAR